MLPLTLFERWKLAKLLLMSPTRFPLLSANPNLAEAFVDGPCVTEADEEAAVTEVDRDRLPPARDTLSDLVIISVPETTWEQIRIPSSASLGFLTSYCLPLGLLFGIAECGKMLGLIGLTIMCSVQLVSNWGAEIRSTSTFRLRCSKGQAKVSAGMLCRHWRANYNIFVAFGTILIWEAVVHSYLEPAEKTEIRVSELGPRQESSELYPIVRLSARSLGLAVVDAGFVQDALDEELQETVVAGHVARRGLH